jgi:hypothetical protein
MKLNGVKHEVRAYVVNNNEDNGVSKIGSKDNSSPLLISRRIYYKIHIAPSNLSTKLSNAIYPYLVIFKLIFKK